MASFQRAPSKTSSTAARSILDKPQAATEAQAALDHTPGEIEGERFVEPQIDNKFVADYA